MKCPDYSKKNDLDNKDCFTFGGLGRLSNFGEVLNKLEEIFNTPEQQGEEVERPLLPQHHMDNKLKDYLLSAHSKFNPKVRENELNVLLICCSDQMDMQKWFHYMAGVSGLFQYGSFHNQEEYNRVDVVVLTNLYHRHYEYWKKPKISNHWDLESSFNLIFSNPFRKGGEKVDIHKLMESIPNYSNEFFSYRVENGIDELRLVHFVLEELYAKGLNYFDYVY